MQKLDGEVLFSASDLVNYLECEHLTSLDLVDLDTPLHRSEDSDEAKLIQAKGIAHEAEFLATLKHENKRVIDISQGQETMSSKVEATIQAMKDGFDIIYQATFQDNRFIGYADFLRKVPYPSLLGAWSYEVMDTKLSRSPKAKFIVQLAYYSRLVEKIQGVPPNMMHVVLGDKTELTYRYADYVRYLNTVSHRFIERIAQGQAQTYPMPCEKCDQCKWINLCEERRLQDDHLCQVANISRLQIKKLESSGVKTLEALATLSSSASVPKMGAETLEKLRHQALLQFQARVSGKRQLELLPLADGELRGFARLPKPATGDLFFDMEGDPLEEGGLEYLFGLYLFEGSKPVFKTFWAHSRAEEKIAFEAFMDFVTGWLRNHPDAHIYHYAAYEQTALKKLMSLHGTREVEVDNLLRAQKMVDLYKVVREGIRVSEPRYSIKNIEHFYSEKRRGDVTSAVASIVYYERWKETRDAQLLLDIANYNEDDVRSTFELREWLLTIRPTGTPWFLGAALSQKDTSEVEELSEVEVRLVTYRERLVDPLPQDRSTWDEIDFLRELTYQLLDFHRRADKPQWWAMYARMEMTEEELLDDGECLAGLRSDPANPPFKVGSSIKHTFLFAEQETKLRTSTQATIAQTGNSVSKLEIDDVVRRVSFHNSTKNEPLPSQIALGPGKPIPSKALVAAIFRFADTLIEGKYRYPALNDYLMQQIPSIKGHNKGEPIVRLSGAAIEEIAHAVANLNKSYLFIQGPPGAGKTYTGSHVIVHLMQRGFKVGISSNSHKAINNLLTGIEKVANQKGYTFSGAKKCTAGNEFGGQFIKDVLNNKDISSKLGHNYGYQLVAGTAWLFADADMDQKLDYLFVDEAGQVAVANLVAMGTSAKNIVLLGDQMQLGQPVQGIHPGRSGESSLEYLLNGMATIPPEKGIFLATTWRMHPDVCSFISNVVYDGRLMAEPGNATQGLILDSSAHTALKPTGITYVPVEHDACSQRSQEEALIVQELFNSLLTQHYRDKKGVLHPITLDDILVVAPFNMQVNLLVKMLPNGARVGTVDKFQGQEAEVVIVSMATSNGDYLPRDIGFLYSKNRLNVAISRAKCLAVFIANPALMSIQCSTPEEMALVNTLCWVREYSQLLH